MVEDWPGTAPEYMSRLVRRHVTGDLPAESGLSVHDSRGLLIVRATNAMHDRIAEFLGTLAAPGARTALYVQQAFEACSAGALDEARYWAEAALSADPDHPTAKALLEAIELADSASRAATAAPGYTPQAPP